MRRNSVCLTTVDLVGCRGRTDSGRGHADFLKLVIGFLQSRDLSRMVLLIWWFVTCHFQDSGQAIRNRGLFIFDAQKIQSLLKERIRTCSKITCWVECGGGTTRESELFLFSFLFRPVLYLLAIETRLCQNTKCRTNSISTRSSPLCFEIRIVLLDRHQILSFGGMNESMTTARRTQRGRYLPNPNDMTLIW